MALVSVSVRNVFSWPSPVSTSSTTAVTALPTRPSLASFGDVLSISLVTVTSEMLGADASRLALAPTGVLMARQQPHCTLPISIQPSLPLCPSAIDSPLMSAPYFRYAATGCSFALVEYRADTFPHGDGPRRPGAVLGVCLELPPKGVPARSVPVCLAGRNPPSWQVS